MFNTSAFVTDQAFHHYCASVYSTVGKPGSVYSNGRNVVLNRHTQMDGVLQKVVPSLLRARILYLEHYPAFARHESERPLYDTLP